MAFKRYCVKLQCHMLKPPIMLTGCRTLGWTLSSPHLLDHIQLLGIVCYIQSNTFHLVSAGKVASRYLVLNLLKPGMLHFVPLRGIMISNKWT